jgi:hypothetical protein
MTENSKLHDEWKKRIVDRIEEELPDRIEMHRLENEKSAQEMGEAEIAKVLLSLAQSLHPTLYYQFLSGMTFALELHKAGKADQLMPTLDTVIYPSMARIEAMDDIKKERSKATREAAGN